MALASSPARLKEDAKSGIINGINLKRQIDNALKLFYNLNNHLFFVDFWETDVDVKHGNAFDILRNAFVENVCNIVFTKSFFESFFTCRVDSFADDYERRVVA